jgi:GT2 family glycosyltransferase
MTSVVVLAYNKWRYTRMCLESLITSLGADFEVLVTDNGSTDETPEELPRMVERFRKIGVELRLDRNETNVGCSTARNAATERARGKTVVWMDNDIMVGDAEWIPKLRARLDARPRARLAGPMLVYPFDPPTIQCAGCAVSPTGRVQFRGRGEPASAPEFNEETPVQALISAVMMFDRALVDEIGGLDEAFNPVQFEDIDFSYRARSRGYDALYVPSVRMVHWESATTQGSAALVNPYLVAKHGLLFKRRWHHMFEIEGGPPDSECEWREIEVPEPPPGGSRSGKEA